METPRRIPQALKMNTPKKPALTQEHLDRIAELRKKGAGIGEIKRVMLDRYKVRVFSEELKQLGRRQPAAKKQAVQRQYKPRPEEYEPEWATLAEDALHIAPNHTTMASLIRQLARDRKYSKFKEQRIQVRLQRHERKEEIKAALREPAPPTDPGAVDWTTITQDAIKLAPQHDNLETLAKAIAGKGKYERAAPSIVFARLVATIRSREIKKHLKQRQADALSY